MSSMDTKPRWSSSYARVIVLLTCAICSTSTFVHAISFGESDVRITETDVTRRTVVRKQSTEAINTLTIKALTPDQFLSLNRNKDGCRELVNTLDNLEQGNKAQSSDFSSDLSELNVTFGDSDREIPINIEVIDDAVSELDETFVLFIANIPDCITLLVNIVDNDELTFKFEGSNVQSFSEGRDRVGHVTVVKVGENEQDVVFALDFVFTTSGAVLGRDINYTPMDLVFTRTKNSTDVMFQIIDDTSPENIENFQICFPNSNHLNVSFSRIEGFPCKNIRIIDDDSLNIGFFNSTMSVREGDGPTNVCFGVLEHGLRLASNEVIYIEINKSALMEGTEGELTVDGDNSFLFPNNERDCVRVTAVDDNVADGSHTMFLTLSLAEGHLGLLVVFVQINITIEVLDNDEITFELAGPGENFSQPVFIREGETRNDILSIRRRGNPIFTYNVTLSAQVSNTDEGERTARASNANEDDEDFVVQSSFIFSVTEDSLAIPIEVIDDLVPEKLERFTVSIAGITTVEETIGTIIMVGDVGSIEFAIYDNDFVVGFEEDPTATSNVPIASGTVIMEGKNSTFEVSVFELQSQDVDPRVMIPITFLVNGVNRTELYGFVVSPSMVVLNTTNLRATPTIIVLDDNQCLGERSYDLHIVPLAANVSIEIANPVITVTILDNDCLCLVCIVVPVVVILIAILIVLLILALLLFVLWRKYYWHNYDPQNMEHLKKNQGQ